MRLKNELQSFHSEKSPGVETTLETPTRIAGGRAPALLYCEGHFGAVDGKTANGLVRCSERYEICAVLDSTRAGLDAGQALDGTANGIPICKDLDDALARMHVSPEYFVFGVAPADGRMRDHERAAIFEAMSMNMNIVSGLQEFLGDDPQMVASSLQYNVLLIDVRRPRPREQLKMFSNRVANLDCPRLAVMGTDCAIGKRTTATLLTQALNQIGVRAVMVSTGQTGLMQGARFGVALDAVPSQFCAGELEAQILDAYATENPDIIIVEGQGALSHPALSTSSFILRGSQPQAVLLQHAPGRRCRCDFESMPMPNPADEIRLIELFANTKVVGLTLNHEGMDHAQISVAAADCKTHLGLPATAPLWHGTEQLVDIVLSSFDGLRAKSARNDQ